MAVAKAVAKAVTKTVAVDIKKAVLSELLRLKEWMSCLKGAPVLGIHPPSFPLFLLYLCVCYFFVAATKPSSYSRFFLYFMICALIGLHCLVSLSLSMCMCVRGSITLFIHDFALSISFFCHVYHCFCSCQCLSAYLPLFNWTWMQLPFFSSPYTLRFLYQHLLVLLRYLHCHTNLQTWLKNANYKKNTKEVFDSLSFEYLWLYFIWFCNYILETHTISIAFSNAFQHHFPY